jgi:hypothetical protein
MTIHHRDPGKVVVDMGSTSITGINANALARLRDALGLEKRPIKVHEPFQLLGLVEDDVIEALELCVALEVSSDYTIFGYRNENWKLWKLPTGLEVLVGEGFVTSDGGGGVTFIHPGGDPKAPPAGRLPKDGYYFDNVFRTFKEYDEDTSNGREDFAEDYKPYTPEQIATIKDNCEKRFNGTDLGIIAGGALAGLGDFAYFPGPHIPYPKGVRNLEDWMVVHKTNPDYVHQIFEYQTEVGLANAKTLWETCGDKIQVMQISGTDFGTQRAPIMSRDSFREFYKPYYKKICDWIHKTTNWKTFFHTCGSVAAFMHDFHETGMDIMNPVQCSATDMDARTLKETWGDKFTFWGGGVDTQKTLPFGTPEEVYDEVMGRLEIFAPGGGFVFNTIHNIQGPTPVENILAMFRAVRDYNARIGA